MIISFQHWFCPQHLLIERQLLAPYLWLWLVVCARLTWSPKHDNYHRHYRQFRWRIIFDWAQKTSIMKIESSNIWHIVYNIAHSLQFYSLILILRSHKFTHCKINHFLQCFVGKLRFFAVYHLLFIISTYISTLLVAIRFTW